MLEQLQEQRDRVDVSTAQFSVRELIRMYEEEELDIAPFYQRQFRWDRKTQSEFIESIFLNLPVPPLYVATNDGFRWEVVDGLQRINTLVAFAASEPATGTLVLGELERLTEFNGKSLHELEETVQRYFMRQALTVTALTDKADMNIRFDLFERLNKGSVQLSAQEVRKCIFRGSFIETLGELAENPQFVETLKLQKARQRDGTGEEQVLKYFAYSSEKFRDGFDGRVEHLLNNYAKENSEPQDLGEMKVGFLGAVATLSEALGGQPYLRTGYAVTPLVQFEASLVAAGMLHRAGEAPSPAANWTDDEDLKSYSMGGTNTKRMLNQRIDRAAELLRGAEPRVDDH